MLNDSIRKAYKDSNVKLLSGNSEASIAWLRVLKIIAIMFFIKQPPHM